MTPESNRKRVSAAVSARADEIAAERREARRRASRVRDPQEAHRQALLDAHAKAIVDAAPPLTDDQRNKIGALLRPSRSLQEQRDAQRRQDEATARQQLHDERQARSIGATLTRYATGGQR